MCALCPSRMLYNRKGEYIRSIPSQIIHNLMLIEVLCPPSIIQLSIWRHEYSWPILLSFSEGDTLRIIGFFWPGTKPQTYSAFVPMYQPVEHGIDYIVTTMMVHFSIVRMCAYTYSEGYIHKCKGAETISLKHRRLASMQLFAHFEELSGCNELRCKI